MWCQGLISRTFGWVQQKNSWISPSSKDFRNGGFLSPYLWSYAVFAMCCICQVAAVSSWDVASVVMQHRRKQKIAVVGLFSDLLTGCRDLEVLSWKSKGVAPHYHPPPSIKASLGFQPHELDRCLWFLSISPSFQRHIARVSSTAALRGVVL